MTRTMRRPAPVRRKERLVVRELTRTDDPAFAVAYRLLRRSFPKRELVSMREWRDTLAERGARLWTDIAWHLIVAVRGQRLVGVATGNYLGNVNIGMVGYLVVDPAERAGGLGTRLRQRLKEAFRADAKRVRGRELTAVIGEVRRDNPWLRALIRNPATLALDFQYLQPRLHRGDSLTPLVLYYEGVAHRRYRLPVDFLRRLLYTTWRRIYRIDRPLASPVFRRMLAGLAGRRSVGETTMRG